LLAWLSLEANDRQGFEPSPDAGDVILHDRDLAAITHFHYALVDQFSIVVEVGFEDLVDLPLEGIDFAASFGVLPAPGHALQMRADGPFADAKDLCDLDLCLPLSL
jgi:hypothetical protein